jgi:hypothetical protein
LVIYRDCIFPVPSPLLTQDTREHPLRFQIQTVSIAETR